MMRRYSKYIIGVLVAGFVSGLSDGGSAFAADAAADGPDDSLSGRTALRISSDYLQGVRYKHVGAVQHASLMFDRVIQADPGHAAAYYNLSEIARLRNDQTGALKYARRAYMLDPEFRKYADNYARQLIVSGDYAGGDRIFADLLQKDSMDMEALGMLAILRFEQNRFEDALAMIDTVERRAEIKPQLVEMKRQSLIRLERYKEAYEYMGQVIRDIPGEAGFHIHYAELAAALRQDSTALSNYRIAIRLDSVSVGPGFALAEYYRIKGMKPQFYEALIPVLVHPEWPSGDKTAYFLRHVWEDDPMAYGEHLTYTIRLVDALRQGAPDDPDVRRLYARHLIYMNRHDEGYKALSDLIDRGEATGEMYSEIIQIALLQEKTDTVTKYMRLAEAKFPQDEDMQLFLMYVRFHRQDTLGTKEAAKRIIRTTRNDTVRASVYGTYADISYMQGDKRTAFRHYEKALELLPDNATVLNNYAYYLSLEKRDLEHALEMSARANELEQQNPVFLDTQAWVLYELGRYEEAQAIMRQALVLDERNNAELLLHFGDISQALGQRFIAETYWQRALEAGADEKEIEKRFGRAEGRSD